VALREPEPAREPEPEPGPGPGLGPGPEREPADWTTVVVDCSNYSLHRSP